MTVNTVNITSGPYTGTGASDQFSYTFRVEDKTQLAVYETDDAGVQTLLTVDTDYTVAGIGVDLGGIITRVAGNLPTGYVWFIRSDYKQTQLTAFPSQGPFFPETHEAAMDKLTFLIQQLQDGEERSFRLDDSVDIDGTFTILQDAAARSGLYLGFGDTGDLVVKSLADASLVDQADLDKRHEVIMATGALALAASPLDIAGKPVTFNPGVTVRTLARTSTDDGGYGTYVVEAGDTSDGGERLLAANGNTLVLQREEVLYLEQLDAVVNTDVTPIVVAALATDAQKVSFRKSGQTYKGSTGTNALRDDFDFDLNGCTIDFVDFEHNTGRTSHYWLTNADSLLDRGGALSRQYRISTTTLSNVKIHNGICKLNRGALVDFSATDFYFVSIDLGTNCHYDKIDVIDTMETDVLLSANVNFSAVLQMARCDNACSITMGKWDRTNYCKTWECESPLVAGNNGRRAVGTAIEDDYSINGVWYRNRTGRLGEYAGSALNSGMGINGEGATIQENIVYNGRTSGITMGHSEASRPYGDSPTLAANSAVCESNRLIFEASLTELDKTTAGIYRQLGANVRIANNIITGLNHKSLVTLADVETNIVNAGIGCLQDNTGIDTVLDSTLVLESNRITSCSKGMHIQREKHASVRFNTVKDVRNIGCFVAGADTVNIPNPSVTFEGNDFDNIVDFVNTTWSNFIYSQASNHINVLNNNSFSNSDYCIYTKKCWVNIDNNVFDTIGVLPVGGTDQHSFTFKKNSLLNSTVTWFFNMDQSVGGPPEPRTTLIDVDKNIGTGSSGSKVRGDGGLLFTFSVTNEPVLRMTTANRPLAALNVPKSWQMFDTTISKMIWHNGADVWIDTSGGAV